MKISKRSWHYRLLRWTWPNSEKVGGELPPMSLCHYVFQLVYLFVFGPPFLVMAAVVFCVIGPIIFLGEWLGKRCGEKKKKTPSEPRTLIGKWLKAKKEKACPFLEWSDECRK